MEKDTLAQSLVYLRKKSNLTQKQLALELNYSDKVISKWERGESLPDITALKSIARYFNVTVDALVSDEEATATSSETDGTSRLLEVKRIKGPPRIMSWSLLPFTILFLSTLFGSIDLFLVSAFIYAFILMTYSVLMAYNTWRVDHRGHILIIRNRPTKAVLEIDGTITDQSGSILGSLKLEGRLGDKTFKVYISSLITMKCSVIVDRPLKTMKNDDQRP